MSDNVDAKKITLLMLLLSFGLGSVVFVLFFPNILLGLLFGSVVTVVGWSLPVILVKALFEKRCDKFVDQLVDGLTIMSNGIKSQSNVAQSMERVIESWVIRSRASSRMPMEPAAPPARM